MPSRENGGSPNKEMGAQSQADRPTKEHIRSKVDDLIRSRAEPGQKRAYYSSAVEAFRNMASGGDDHGSRDKEYPGWTNEDFKEVLDWLGESSQKKEEAPPWR